MAIKSKIARNVGVAVISIPMLLYGASALSPGSGGATIVKVDDRIMTAEVLQNQIQNEINRNVEEYGNLSAEREEQLRQALAQNIVNSTVRNFLLQERMERLGILPVQEEVESTIRSNEQFQVDGEYSPSRFEALVANPRYYINQVREQLLGAKLEQSFTGGAIISEDSMQQLASYFNEERHVHRLEFPIDYAATELTLTDDELRGYYLQTSEDYLVPERAKFEYVWVRPEDFQDQVVVDEQLLREAQENRAVRAKENEERKLRLIAVPTAARANEVLDLARAPGADFASLAQEYSQDVGTSAVGGDIGFLTRADLVNETANAVFAADVNDVVGPFEVDGQWMLFKVEGSVGGHVEDFDEIRERLIEEVTAEQLDLLVSQTALELEDVAFGNGDDLQLIVQNLNLQTHTSDWIDIATLIEEQPAPFDELEILTELFAPEFIATQQNSPLLRRTDGSYLVARLVEHEPEYQRTFEEALDEVKEVVRRQEAVSSKVTEISAKLQRQFAGEVLPELAFDEQPAVVITQAGELPEGFNDTERNHLFTREAITGDVLPVYASFYSEDKDSLLVYKINKIVPGEIDEENLQRIIDTQANYYSLLLVTGYLGELNSVYDVAVAQELR